MRRWSGAVLHAIADYAVHSYVAVAQLVELGVYAIGKEIFTPASKLTIEPTYQIKRETVGWNYPVSARREVGV